jgi:hypothetical protein
MFTREEIHGLQLQIHTQCLRAHQHGSAKPKIRLRIMSAEGANEFTSSCDVVSTAFSNKPSLTHDFTLNPTKMFNIGLISTS